jgi:hypothetical protein
MECQSKQSRVQHPVIRSCRPPSRKQPSSRRGSEQPADRRRERLRIEQLGEILESADLACDVDMRHSERSEARSIRARLSLSRVSGVTASHICSSSAWLRETCARLGVNTWCHGALKRRMSLCGRDDSQERGLRCAFTSNVDADARAARAAGSRQRQLTIETPELRWSDHRTTPRAGGSANTRASPVSIKAWPR